METWQVVEAARGLASAAAPVVVNAAGQGMILLAAVWLTVRLMGRASAAMRHLVWCLAMAGLLALPAASALAPGWQVLRVWIEPDGRAPVEAAGAVRSAEAMPKASTPVAGAETGLGAAREKAAEEAPPAVQAPLVRAAARGWSWPRLTPADGIVLAWLAGVGVALAPLGLGLVSVRRLERRAQRVRGGPCLALLRQAGRVLGVGREVTLLLGEGLAMPMAWGIRRPRILLPCEAAGWPEARLRAVIVHELAHVKRRDCLAQILGQFACAAHWFNPLVWAARRLMVAERERACDDLVLRSGMGARDYAEHLLRVASGLKARWPGRAAAIAMARPSSLEGRLLAILDAKRNRGTLTRLAALSAVALLVGLTVPVAMLRAGPAEGPVAAGEGRKAPEGTQAAGKSFEAALPGGLRVELVGVSYHPSTGRPWWRPDGSACPEGPFANPHGEVYAGDKGGREFVVRLREAPEGGVVTNWRIGAALSQAGGGPPLVDGKPRKDLRMLTAQLPASASRANVAFGAAVGPWQTVAESDPAGGGTVSHGDNTVLFSKGFDEKEGAAVTVAHNAFDCPVRVTAVDVDGRERLHSSGAGGGTDVFAQTTATFHGVPLARVKRFRLQVQPYQWVEFRNVALEPGLGTEVEVKVFPPPSAEGGLWPTARVGRAQIAAIEKRLRDVIAARLQKEGFVFDGVSVVIWPDLREADVTVDRPLRRAAGQPALTSWYRNVPVPTECRLSVKYAGGGNWRVAGLNASTLDIQFTVTALEILGTAR